MAGRSWSRAKDFWKTRHLVRESLSHVETEVERQQPYGLRRRDISVGDTNRNELTNTGIDHGADLGGGYPLDRSGILGRRRLDAQAKNPVKQYESGIDFHLDLGVSQFLSKQVIVG